MTAFRAMTLQLPHRLQTLLDSKVVLMSSRAFQIGASEFCSEESQVVLSTIDSMSRFLPSFFPMNALCK